MCKRGMTLNSRSECFLTYKHFDNIMQVLTWRINKEGGLAEIPFLNSIAIAFDESGFE